MLIKFGFLIIEEALWKMENNAEEAMCKIPRWMLVFTNFPCTIVQVYLYEFYL